MLELGLKFTLAYLVGGVMGAFVVGRLRGGIDIRQMGSGNAGATNALRTQGKAFAAGVMLVDVGKGILVAALLPGLAFPGVGIDVSVSRELVLHAVAFAAILGHVFPVWADFKGGKGGATAAGLVIYLAPALGVGVIGIWLLIVFFTGIVGLATMSATLAAAVYLGLFVFPERAELFGFACLVSALTLYTHRGNIVRMAQGKESRFRRFFGLGSS
ncbi:MAG: glycerol-3-phosphate 1-O-acyltransferase PlsY [Gammaproteobacteria bacterium]|jgi:glycerol-3-phosphate acyltransferase PlsY